MGSCCRRLPAHDFAATLDVAFLQLHSYILHDAEVTRHLFEVYAELAARVHRHAEQEKVWEHLGRLAFSAGRTTASPWDRATFNEHLRRAAAALNRPPDELLLAPTVLPSYN